MKSNRGYKILASVLLVTCLAGISSVGSASLGLSSFYTTGEDCTEEQHKLIDCGGVTLPKDLYEGGCVCSGYKNRTSHFPDTTGERGISRDRFVHDGITTVNTAKPGGIPGFPSVNSKVMADCKPDLSDVATSKDYEFSWHRKIGKCNFRVRIKAAECMSNYNYVYDLYLNNEKKGELNIAQLDMLRGALARLVTYESADRSSAIFASLPDGVVVTQKDFIFGEKDFADNVEIVFTDKSPCEEKLFMKIKKDNELYEVYSPSLTNIDSGFIRDMFVKFPSFRFKIGPPENSLSTISIVRCGKSKPVIIVDESGQTFEEVEINRAQKRLVCRYEGECDSNDIVHISVTEEAACLLAKLSEKGYVNIGTCADAIDEEFNDSSCRGTKPKLLQKIYTERVCDEDGNTREDTWNELTRVVAGKPISLKWKIATPSDKRCKLGVGEYIVMIGNNIDGAMRMSKAKVDYLINGGFAGAIYARNDVRCEDGILVDMMGKFIISYVVIREPNPLKVVFKNDLETIHISFEDGMYSWGCTGSDRYMLYTHLFNIKNFVLKIEGSDGSGNVFIVERPSGSESVSYAGVVDGTLIENLKFIELQPFESRVVARIPVDVYSGKYRTVHFNISKKAVELLAALEREGHVDIFVQKCDKKIVGKNLGDEPNDWKHLTRDEVGPHRISMKLSYRLLSDAEIKASANVDYQGRQLLGDLHGEYEVMVNDNPYVAYRAKQKELDNILQTFTFGGYLTYAGSHEKSGCIHNFKKHLVIASDRVYRYDMLNVVFDSQRSDSVIVKIEKDYYRWDLTDKESQYCLDVLFAVGPMKIVFKGPIVKGQNAKFPFGMIRDTAHGPVHLFGGEKISVDCGSKVMSNKLKDVVIYTFKDTGLITGGYEFGKDDKCRVRIVTTKIVVDLLTRWAPEYNLCYKVVKKNSFKEFSRC